MSTREKRIHPPRAEPTDDGIRGRREQRTIHDVARRAKVSVGTVSKALNNKGRLRQETRERIIAAAKDLGYRPNDLAQSLHRARSMTVGILSTDSFGRFSFPIVAAIERRLFDHGVAVFMCNATDDPSRERRHIDQLLGKRVDGIVVTARRVDRREPIEPAARGLPVVYVFSRVEHPGRVLPAARRRGRREARGPAPCRSGTQAHRLRSPGRSGSRRSACARRAIARRSPRPACRRGPRCRAAGRRPGAARRRKRLFSRRRTAPDALFCGNDQIARGAIEALREMGLAVPTDVAVVGFDNWDVMTEATRPPLTSVDMNLDALGREAGAALLEMMAGARLAGVRRLPCSLVVRDSCGAHSFGREGKGSHDRRAHIPLCRSQTSGSPARSGASGSRPCSSARFRASTPSSRRSASSSSLKLPKPVPPLTIPRNAHGFTMQVFWDSDVGKWIEAASYALSHRRDADIEAKIDAIVDDLARAQSPDGYLNCWYNGREPDKRWTNLRDNHELYNAGHLLEGAIAYFRATGRRRFLDIMERYVDHIAATFGTGPGQKRGYPGHQEIELALVKLYRLTGDRRRLDLAAYFIDERGRSRTISPRKRWRAATIRPPIGRGPMNTTSPTFPCASRRRWSAMRCAACTWPRRWRTSPSNSATMISSARAKRCGATSRRRRCM